MIKFEVIRWRNLLSTGNAFTEIQLDKSANTLIIGNNGAGKSTILDAICFGLFNKPFRKINKPNLINSINQQQCVVEIEFSIGKKKYKVVRGIKPNVFEIWCNGTMLNQDAAIKDYQDHLEKFILKLNYKTFTQVVILGSASFVPFMQLSPGDRRTVIEDLLDIGIFSSMNNVVKEKMTVLKDDYTKNKYAMDIIAEKIILQKQNIEEHKSRSEVEIDKKRKEMSNNVIQTTQFTNDISLIQKHIDVLNNKISDKVDVERKSSKLLQIEAKLESRLKKLEKEEKFYEENHDCPTCKQSIADTFRHSQLGGINQTKGEVGIGIKDVENKIQKANERIEEIQKIVKQIQEHNNEIVRKNSTIVAIHNYNEKINNEINEIEKNKNNVEEENQKLKDLKQELQLATKKQEELASEKQYLEFASSLLKDTGIKTKIIKQYLPVMNKLINKYLTAMDFFVNFNINENFEETIKSRHRDEFSYANFSEGEKMRIDLALLFTWRQIAKMKNSTNTNLLILDEVFDSSLDAVGTDEFMKLIRAMDKDTNIFVISHKGDMLFEKFLSVIKFKKVNNFSQVEK
jgi:DNA repair exonuclease SbcCD ATPase subunit